MKTGDRGWGTVRAPLLAAVLAGCAGRAQVAAPTEGHKAEPVAPVMMPVATVQPPRAREIVAHLADSAINAPMWRNARWGVLVVDPQSGDTLYAHDADRLFMPASNQKLLTGAIALQLLGPDYRWHTPVLLRGTQRGKEFRGDIVVIGRGDPSVSDTLRGGDASSAFDPVVQALEARGITRVNGDIVAEGDAFTGISTGFGWEIDDLDTPSGAPVDELLFGEGLLRLMVRGAAAAGKPATVSHAAPLSHPAIRVEATTRLASDSGAGLEIAYDSIGGVLRVTGTIAVGDSARLSTSYRHPADAYRAAMRERLVSRGVRIHGKHVAAARGSVAHVDTLVMLESPPLRDVLTRMQKPSQNQVAEMLFRTSGLVATGNGGPDSARAVAARTLASWGIGTEGAAYRDGSGLSRHDYVSPRAIVRVLDAMHRSPWAELYRRSLPLAGVDGTIANRMKNTPAAGNANAKTGTLDKARSLSGYVTTADGRVLMFSMLANNFTVPTREVERVQDLLVSTLAGLRTGEVASGR